MNRIQTVKVVALTALVFLTGGFAGIQSYRAYYDRPQIKIAVEALSQNPISAADLKKLSQKLHPLVEAWLRLRDRAYDPPSFDRALTAALAAMVQASGDKYASYLPPTNGTPGGTKRTAAPSPPPPNRPVVTGQLVEHRGQRLWHLRIRHFETDTLEQLAQSLAQARHSKAAGIILDLRGNGGGWIEVCQRVASAWLKPGRTVAWRISRGDATKNPPGTAMPALKAKGITGRLTQRLTAILVDRRTASASEMLVGALRDQHGEYTGVFGVEPTFGKGCMQQVYRLSNNGQLRLTTARFQTPHWRKIHGRGLLPQIGLEPANRQDPNETDPLLRRAAEWLVDELER